MRSDKVRVLAILVLTLLSVAPGQGQPLPDDLQPISPEAIPARTCNFFSIADPGLAPRPANTYGDVPLYYSASVGIWAIFADDREAETMRLLSRAAGYSMDDQDETPTIEDYTSSTNLVIFIKGVTNKVIEGTTNLFAQLLMSNTISAVPYEVVSSTNVELPLSNWFSQGVWIGLSNTTPANVAVADRTNRNFFRAHVWNGFTHGVPTNGQLFLLLSDTNSIQAVVNATTNDLAPFYGNYAMARTPGTNGDILQTFSFNAGYLHDDNGDTNYLSDFDQQHVQAFLGFSATASNVALCYNPLTNIDVRGWPKLYDLECWHTTNLISGKISGCYSLHRVCFEACDTATNHGLPGALDLTGCTNLADVRGAQNRFTNIIFGGAGPKIFHLCIRDNHNTLNSPQLPNIDFSQFPSMKELWIWGDYSFYQPLTITSANASNLTSVEVFNNNFTSADFSGQTNLDHIFINSDSYLTNLSVSGCSKLNWVDASFCSLSASAVDSVLTVLDSAGLRSGRVLLQAGASAAPSTEGYQHALNLLNKRWAVTITLPSGTPQVYNLATTPNSATSTTITWSTDIASDSTLYHSATTNSYDSTNIVASVTNHSITLTGLSSNTLYHFYVTSASSGKVGTSANLTFVTLGNTNAIWFTNLSQSVAMQVSVVSGGSATWYWGDGSNSVGTSASHTFVNAGSYSNAVVIDPWDKLIGFGASCANQNSAATTLTSVLGLTNYPNLASLLLVNSHLTSLSLAGCSNLTHVALVHTSPSTNMENGWFSELAAAQQAGGASTNGITPLCGEGQRILFCPADPGSPNRAVGSAYWTLTNSLKWTVTEFEGAQ